MKWTDRYVRLPIKIYDRKQEELTGRRELTDTECRLLASCIEHYHDAGTEDGQPCIYLVMKSGATFNVYLTVDEFERRVNDHEK